MHNFICVLIIIVLGILKASAHSKLSYPEECREEAEMCQDNPIVHDIETSDDYWKAGFQPYSIFSFFALFLKPSCNLEIHEAYKNTYLGTNYSAVSDSTCISLLFQAVHSLTQLVPSTYLICWGGNA